jgi:capsular exopolysaccharide synthesis family protein
VEDERTHTHRADRPRQNDLRSFLAIAGRRWLTILLVLTASVGIAAVLSLRTTPTYDSQVSLLASTQSQNSAQAYQAGLLAEERVATYANLVASKPVAQQTVKQLGLSESPVGLSERISAEASSSILTITVQDSDPAQAKRIASTTSKVFVDYVKGLESGQNASSPVQLSALGPASTPTEPSSPQPLRDISIAAVLGLVLGCGIALLRELMDNRLTDGEKVEDLAGAPVIGMIPDDSKASRRPVVRDGEPGSPRGEALRSLRTNVRYLGIGRSGRVCMVTSSVPGEGRTTTALNLAVMMSEAGQRVALVEGDLRRPQIHDYLRVVDPTVGLTTVLMGELNLVEALQQPYPELPLHVLASGEVPANPTELLQSDAAVTILGTLRDSYDAVIINAPPLNLFTDSALIASMSEATLLVVRHGHTTQEQVRRSMQRLQHVNAPLAGVVLTRVPHKRTGRYGYDATVGMRTPADDAMLSGSSGPSGSSGFSRSRG